MDDAGGITIEALSTEQAQREILPDAPIDVVHLLVSSKDGDGGGGHGE